MSKTTEEIRIGELGIRFLLEGKDTGGALAMFEFDVAPGGKVPVAHSHDTYEETAYGIQGVMTFTVDGQREEIRPGEVLCIPRGAVHRFDNLHPEKAKMPGNFDTRHSRPGIFSRDCGGVEGVSRRSAEPDSNWRGDAAAWADTGAMSRP